MPATLVPISGMIQNVTPVDNTCCQQRVSIRTSNGINNFIIGPDTYVIGEVRLRPGMQVTAFYDADLPIPLIFPPQYQAVIIGRRNPQETIYAGTFNNNLVADDNSLQLNIASTTEVSTANGQRFTCRLGGQMLVVYYSETTRSIPPQTTPRKVIVIC